MNLVWVYLPGGKMHNSIYTLILNKLDNSSMIKVQKILINKFLFHSTFHCIMSLLNVASVSDISLCVTQFFNIVLPA